MIYFFCGAPKHGSHFQLFVITEALKQRGFAYESVGGKVFDNHDMTAARELLHRLDAEPRERTFVMKGHWSTRDERRLLLSLRNVRIFHIWRDIHDVLVSHHHYLMRRYEREYRDFDDYYWRDGRPHLLYQAMFRRRWQGIADDRIHHTSFAKLRTDFEAEAAPLLGFAGISGVDLPRLQEQVAISKLRKQNNDPNGILLRRGAVGEGAEIIKSADVRADIEQICSWNTPRLRLEAVRANPRVIFRGYYDFPGKQLLVSGQKAFRSVFPKQTKRERRGPAMWWS